MVSASLCFARGSGPRRAFDRGGKTAIADEGLADDYPLTVDADHGRVTLTGGARIAARRAASGHVGRRP